MPGIPNPPERFGDDLVELREIAEWDIPEVLIAHQDDRELHVLRGLSRPPSGAELGREVEQAESNRLQGNSVTLTIVEPARNDCRGRVEVDGIDWDAGSADVRVWTAPQMRGRGYEQHAADLAADWLSSGVGLRNLTISLLT